LFTIGTTTALAPASRTAMIRAGSFQPTRAIGVEPPAWMACIIGTPFEWSIRPCW
jgi:hypothetical protein